MSEIVVLVVLYSYSPFFGSNSSCVASLVTQTLYRVDACCLPCLEADGQPGDA